jgi:hypothetical protein
MRTLKILPRNLNEIVEMYVDEFGFRITSLRRLYIKQRRQKSLLIYKITEYTEFQAFSPVVQVASPCPLTL